MKPPAPRMVNDWLSTDTMNAYRSVTPVLRGSGKFTVADDAIHGLRRAVGSDGHVAPDANATAGEDHTAGVDQPWG
jgi:hypothetical protein